MMIHLQFSQCIQPCRWHISGSSGSASLATYLYTCLYQPSHLFVPASTSPATYLYLPVPAQPPIYIPTCTSPATYLYLPLPTQPPIYISASISPATYLYTCLYQPSHLFIYLPLPICGRPNTNHSILLVP